MTAPRCSTPTCRRTVADAFVCPRCTDDLVRALTEHPDVAARPGARRVHGMAALVADLELAAARGSRLAPAGGAQSGESPVPVALGAAEALWVLNSTLGTWVRDLCEHRAIPVPWLLLDVTVWPRGLTRRTLARPTQVVGAALFLVEQRDAVRQHQAGGQLVDEVRHAVAHARASIDRPQDLVFCGRCPHCTEIRGDEKHAPELLARPGDIDVVCPDCGRSHLIRTRQQAILDKMRDRLGTATEISGMLREVLGMAVSVQRISMRRSRGQLAVRGEIDGHPLYRAGDIIDLALDDRPRQDARR